MALVVSFKICKHHVAVITEQLSDQRAKKVGFFRVEQSCLDQVDCLFKVFILPDILAGVVRRP